MIDRDHDLSLRHQADILQISRSSLYYVPVEISAADLELMRKIDLLHTDYPFMGARMLRDRLKALGYSVGRRHVARLMRRMGIEALYRKKRTTKRNPEHPVFPYLLRGLTIDRPNQVWAADISYIPMRRVLVSLCRFGLGDAPRAGLAPVEYADDGLLHRDGARRDRRARPAGSLQYGPGKPIYRCGFRGADSQEARHCAQYGRQRLLARQRFHERFWRSLKYEEVYLHAYESASQARAAIGKYIAFYNGTRPHSALDGRTPDAAYFTSPAVELAA